MSSYAFKLLFCTSAFNAIDIQSSERSMYAFRGKGGGGKGGRETFVEMCNYDIKRVEN